MVSQQRLDAADEAAHEAKLAILKQIAGQAAQTSPMQLHHLAEAYAWAIAPGQSHGGGGVAT
jgi:hypothetical protein